VLLGRAIAAREERLAHLDALDTKAGIMFGFAAVIVAVSVVPPLVFGVVVAGFAATGSVYAFAALRLRGVRLTDPVTMWSRHRGDEPPALELSILATTMSEMLTLDKTLRDKAHHIYTAQVWLIAAVAANVVGIAIELGREVFA
jgi:uncharacterized membrane protein YedE/YeeE